MSDVSLNPQGSSVTPTGAEGGEMETLRAELAASQAANEKLRLHSNSTLRLCDMLVTRIALATAGKNSNL